MKWSLEKIHIPKDFGKQALSIARFAARDVPAIVEIGGAALLALSL
jgi:hypothetical protein